MKELTIKVRSIIREFIVWIIMFGLAFYTNIYAIREFNTSWDELWSQIHIVLILSFVYYIVFAIVRLLGYGIYLAVKLWVMPVIAKVRAK